MPGSSGGGVSLGAAWTALAVGTMVGRRRRARRWLSAFCGGRWGVWPLSQPLGEQNEQKREPTHQTSAGASSRGKIPDGVCRTKPEPARRA